MPMDYRRTTNTDQSGRSPWKISYFTGFVKQRLIYQGVLMVLVTDIFFVFLKLLFFAMLLLYFLQHSLLEHDGLISCKYFVTIYNDSK